MRRSLKTIKLGFMTSVLAIFIASILIRGDFFDNSVHAGVVGRNSTLGSSGPNILYIMLDDVGYGDINSYYKILKKNSDLHGYTNNLDSLTNEGAVFTNMYACPMCTSSRAQFLTGCYPSLPQVNLKLHENYGFGLPDTKDGKSGVTYTMPEYLKELGYSTGIFGKWHLGDANENLPDKHGFDQFFGTMFPNDGKELFYYKRDGNSIVKEDKNFVNSQHDVTDKVIKNLDEFVQTNKDSKFFAYVSLLNLHADIKKLLIQNNERIYPNGKPNAYAAKNLYFDLVKDMDNTIGQIKDVLKAQGVLDNTIIVLTSDNGPQWHLYDEKGNITRYQSQRTLGLYDGKDSIYDGGVRIPFMIWGPSYIKPGNIVNDRTSTIDMFPTLISIANRYSQNNNVDTMLKNDTVNGMDISGLVMKESRMNAEQKLKLQNYMNRERPIFLFYENHSEPSGVIKGNYKFVYNRYTDAPELLQSTINTQPGQSSKYVAFPDEKKNLMNDPSHKSAGEDLQREIANFSSNGHDKLRNKVDELKSPKLDEIRKKVAQLLEEKKKQLAAGN